jgi:hypothetical protein
LTPADWHSNDVLTRGQLAARLQVDPSVTYRWRECPRFQVGREQRFIWGDVLDWLRNRSRADTTASRSLGSSTSTGHGQVFSMPHRAGRGAA